MCHSEVGVFLDAVPGYPHIGGNVGARNDHF